MPKKWFRSPHLLVQLLIILAVAGYYLFCNRSIFTDYSKVKVAKIIDGDTIILDNGKHLRYLGIDTPETHLMQEGNWVYAPQPFGKEAAEFNRGLVEGKTIKVEFDTQKNDKYSRLLGYCYLPDGQIVNAKMLEEGYATLFIKAPNIKHTDIFLAAQNKARESKKNLWGGLEVIPAADAGNYLDQIRTIRGKVEKIYDAGTILLLSFGKNYKTAFTVVIFDDAKDFFYKKNINPAVFYSGKTLEVSGRIKNFMGRPEIVISIPEEITILEDSASFNNATTAKTGRKRTKHQKK
jgi:micrococcal nuclease